MSKSVTAKIKQFDSNTLVDTQRIGAEIASNLSFPSCVYLIGDMGAGKTTLCQSIIRSFGYSGTITSPTYNLIHEYPVSRGTVYHLDLYRLQEPAELQFLGLADLCSDNSLFLVEWPNKGEGFLPVPTHVITISNHPDNIAYKQIVVESFN
jgi:tRNA threonylcarbamoyladenosine biosynthesis protein TsaE